jgi:hypothetical protein
MGNTQTKKRVEDEEVYYGNFVNLDGYKHIHHLDGKLTDSLNPKAKIKFNKIDYNHYCQKWVLDVELAGLHTVERFDNVEDALTRRQYIENNKHILLDKFLKEL